MIKATNWGGPLILGDVDAPAGCDSSCTCDCACGWCTAQGVIGNPRNTNSKNTNAEIPID